VESIRNCVNAKDVCVYMHAYIRTLALTSPTGGGRSVGIVRSRTKATEFVCLFVYIHIETFFIYIHPSIHPSIRTLVYPDIHPLLRM
jgi:hypothetical protein